MNTKWFSTVSLLTSCTLTIAPSLQHYITTDDSLFLLFTSLITCYTPYYCTRIYVDTLHYFKICTTSTWQHVRSVCGSARYNRVAGEMPSCGLQLHSVRSKLIYWLYYSIVVLYVLNNNILVMFLMCITYIYVIQWWASMIFKIWWE